MSQARVSQAQCPRQGGTWSRIVMVTTVVMALIGLGGCTTVPTPSVSPSSATIQGRLALKVGASAQGPERQFSALFVLSGDEQRGRLELNSPLGLTLALAHWQPGRVELQTPQETVVLRDLGTLAERTLGTRVPLEAVFEWLRGRAWPQSPHRITEGNPTQVLAFEQLGWKIDLRGFAEGSLIARRLDEPTITLQARWDPRP